MTLHVDELILFLSDLSVHCPESNLPSQLIVLSLFLLDLALFVHIHYHALTFFPVYHWYILLFSVTIAIGETTSAATSTATSTSLGCGEQYVPRRDYNFPSGTFGDKHKRQRSCKHKWFEEFSWLHYLPQNDAVLCYPCSEAHMLSM